MKPRLVSLVLACAAATACNREVKPEQTVGAAPAQAPSSVEVTPDRTAPGGLLESEVLQFGVRLPRGLEVSSVFGTKAIASGQVSPDDVAEYLRHRVDAKHVELAQGSIVFPSCRFLETRHRVRLEILGQGIRSRLVIEDLERPVASETKSSEARWREVGMTPDGRTSDQLE